MRRSSCARPMAACLLCCCLAADARAAIQFVPGDFYGDNSYTRMIYQYDSHGAFVGSLPLPVDVRGLAFGPDGLLYTVAPDIAGFSVLALDATGAVHTSYRYNGSYVAGNGSYGKIAFDNANHFFVGGPTLVRFELSDPASGRPFTNDFRAIDTLGVSPLPTGNLLLGSDYGLFEATPDGTIVRNFPAAQEAANLQGIAYDAATDSIFVTRLGSTDDYYPVLKIDRATGQLVGRSSYFYGDDMVITTDGRLIVGSTYQPAGIFTERPARVGSFEGTTNIQFVTQYVPAPPVALPALVAAATLHRRRPDLRKTRSRRTRS